MGIPKGSCSYQHFTSPSLDAAPASGGHPETLRQPASSEVPTPACRYHFLISTPAASLAFNSPSEVSDTSASSSPGVTRCQPGVHGQTLSEFPMRVGEVGVGRGSQGGPSPLTPTLPLLQSKLSAVSLRGIGSPSTDASASDVHGNFAFEGIGDEDL